MVFLHRYGDIVPSGQAGFIEVTMSDERVSGTVKWFNDDKGFGFIEREDGKDVFVHRTGIKDARFGLETDQEVQFEIKESDRGPVAFNVEII